MEADQAGASCVHLHVRDPETGEYTMEKAPLYHLVGEEEEAA